MRAKAQAGCWTNSANGITTAWPTVTSLSLITSPVRLSKTHSPTATVSNCSEDTSPTEAVSLIVVWVTGLSEKENRGGALVKVR